jgi:excisionase family DNA binding protein
MLVEHGSSTRLLTPEEVADLLQVPVTWVREAARTGRIPGAVKLGKYWRFKPSEVREYIGA